MFKKKCYLCGKKDKKSNMRTIYLYADEKELIDKEVYFHDECLIKIRENPQRYDITELLRYQFVMYQIGRDLKLHSTLVENIRKAEETDRDSAYLWLSLG